MVKWINEEALEVLSKYYYPRAKMLQERCNWGSEDYRGIDMTYIIKDPLMQNIEIYDCFTRNAAGFSNVLQDLWFKHNTPKWHHMSPNRQRIIQTYDTSSWDLATWLWIFMVHRNTGSGASFQDDHGYRNNIVQEMGQFYDFIQMKRHLKSAWESGRALFTSIGNQPPAPKKGVSNIEFLLNEAPGLCCDLADWLEKKQRGHKDVVDFLNTFNRNNGHRRFNFQYAALSMDISDYFPDLVDADSHTYLGNNAKRCGKMMFTGFSDDAMMDEVIDATGGKAKDLEDVLCDFVRFGQNYDPWKRGEFYNNSGWVSGWEDRSK